ncbi:MAG: prolyl oligopeptidase family serine peptidase [Aliiglaciecola sp.]|uniref:prolyl oligopeptidase family serine peptidase n=1 Tax=Aliiglaciecola sp. TaxID=1872441 RepID=UPI003299F12A
MNKFLLLIVFCSLLITNQSLLAVPIPAEKLFNEPAVKLPDLSPDGQYASFLANHSGTSYLSLLDLETKELEGILILDNDQTLTDYNWLDANTLLVSVIINGQNRLVVTYREANSNNGKWQNVLLDQRGYLVSRLPDDNSKILIAVQTYNSNTYSELYKLPIQGLIQGDFDAKHLISGLPPEQRYFAYDSQIDRLILMGVDTDSENLLIAIRTLEKPQLLRSFNIDVENIDFLPVGFLSETTLAVLSNKDSNTQSLFEFDLITQSFGKQLYSHNKYDLVRADVSPFSGEVNSVSFNDHGRLRTEYFNQQDANNSVILRQQFPDNQYITAAKNDVTGQSILFIFDSDKPGSYYLFDHKAQKAELLLATFPALEQYDTVKNQLLNVTSEDGTEIEAFLTLAKKPNLKTLLVMPHGGPVGVREVDAFSPEVQYFVSRGFSVLRVNFRGSSGYGKEFLEAGVGELGKLIETDITVAVDKVLKENDFEHTCAMGSSYGGYSSVILAMNQPDRYECVVGAFGVYDLPLLFNSSNWAVLEEEQIRWENVVGEQSDELLDVSPVYMAEKLKAPTLLIGGVQDKIASVEQTRRMEYVLRRLNKPVQSLYYKNEGHGHSKWNGDWHQSTLTYQFLIEQLGLSPLQKEQILSTDLSKISEEYYWVGLNYDSTKNVNINRKLAHKFYLIAASLGHVEALYQLGRDLENGEGAPADFQKALAYYQQASEEGSAYASYHLGTLYSDGKLVPKDPLKAFEYYNLAKSLKFNATVNVKLAKAYCLGEGVTQNTNSCIELLDLNQQVNDKSPNLVNNFSYAFRELELAKLLLSEQISLETRTQIKLAIQRWYELDTLAVEVDMDEYGKIGQSATGISYDSSSNIEFSENNIIGVLLDVDIDGSYKNRTAKTGLVAHWKINTSNEADEIDDKKFSYLLIGTKYKYWYTRLGLSEIPESAISAELQVFDLDRNLKFSHTFNLIPE